MVIKFEKDNKGYRYFRKFFKGVYVIVRVDTKDGRTEINYYTRHGMVEKTYIPGMLYNDRPHYVRGNEKTKKYIEQLERKGAIPNLFHTWWNNELVKTLGATPRITETVALFGGYNC